MNLAVRPSHAWLTMAARTGRKSRMEGTVMRCEPQTFIHGGTVHRGPAGATCLDPPQGPAAAQALA